MLTRRTFLATLTALPLVRWVPGLRDGFQPDAVLDVRRADTLLLDGPRRGEISPILLMLYPGTMPSDCSQPAFDPPTAIMMVTPLREPHGAAELLLGGVGDSGELGYWRLLRNWQVVCQGDDMSGLGGFASGRPITWVLPA